MSGLAGKRILIVEDEFLIAATAVDMLEEQGATVIGPATTIAQAHSLAETEEIDAAVLDVNLHGERIERVAEALRERRIPFVFTTGYGERAFDREQSAPILDKPYTDSQLARALLNVLNSK